MQRVPISSVVLSSQRVDLKDALFTANKDKGAADQVNPLVLDGQKLIPSVTRVFSKTKDMYIYLQAYERGADYAAAASGVRHFLSRPNQSLRNAADIGDGRNECQVKSGADAVQRAAR